MIACLWANALYYPNTGGHLWMYLNWALGLRDCGFKVIWLESVKSKAGIREALATLKGHLRPYGFADAIALCPSGNDTSFDMIEDVISLEAATEADILLDFAYSNYSDVVKRFRHSVLVDIDPGLTQTWINDGLLVVAPHDHYFTIGENVGSSESVPHCGLIWHHVPPCVALDWWKPTAAPNHSPYTTIAHWWAKRMGFLPYLHLPQDTSVTLELALCFGGEGEEHERAMLQDWGWSIRNARKVAPTTRHYQRYIQGSRGEFSCAKPAYVRLQNAWISDRTLCYLASGKPALVQYTGPSRFLPDCEGLLRFRNPQEAIIALAKAEANYDEHSRASRALAEELFDARRVIRGLMERVFT